jgi:hypothetical protein
MTSVPRLESDCASERIRRQQGKNKSRGRGVTIRQGIEARVSNHVDHDARLHHVHLFTGISEGQQ